MTRKKAHTSHDEISQKSPKIPVDNSKKKGVFIHAITGNRLPYLLSFVTLWIFCTFTYGEVFTRTAEESFICSDYDLMKSLTDQDFGHLYVLGRYLLLIFHSKWLGGLLFSLLLTASAFFLDTAFRIPKWLRGVSTLFPFAFLTYWVSQEITIYYRSEPSLFLLQGCGILVISALMALISHFTRGKSHDSTLHTDNTKWRKLPIGTGIMLLCFLPLEIYAHTVGENTNLTAKMQNSLLENDFESLVEEGLSAKQPSRSVAAYYAIGLQQNDILLDHMFDISYHYPDILLPQNTIGGEYGIFEADCNFYAGLLNASYHNAMDHLVLAGPRLYYLKRIALCAILNQEKDLARKYLDIISKMPFQKEFVETYEPMVDHPELAAQNVSFNKILNLVPMEKKLEQNYRTPIFLGYNTTMMEGNNYALAPSIAACLYSKDLANVMIRAAQYKRIVGSLPIPVQEAMIIHSNKHPEVFQIFPELMPQNKNIHSQAAGNVYNFYETIQKYYQDKFKDDANWRQKMSEDLKSGIKPELHDQLAPEWVGHYVFYHYCENIVLKAQANQEEKSGVN